MFQIFNIFVISFMSSSNQLFSHLGLVPGVKVLVKQWEAQENVLFLVGTSPIVPCIFAKLLGPHIHSLKGSHQSFTYLFKSKHLMTWEAETC